MSNGIVFQVETARILKILSSEIYDSPLAMLRENVQNAYDAIRMRFAESGELAAGAIDIKVGPGELEISDNGVGMSEEVLRDNFWKAGSSGKNNSAARRAGVVGTFGIGAMANFGVCERLVIETRAIGSDQVLRSTASINSLKIGEECIEFEKLPPTREVGTTLVANLDPKFSLTRPQVVKYLVPYVGMIEVDVRVNGETISRQDDSRAPKERSYTTLGGCVLSDNLFAAKFDVAADPNGQARVVVSDIQMGGQATAGQLRLVQSGGQLMGYRSSFGLAPVPVAGNYQFGGIANLSFLEPTAGREALSRESIEHVSRLVKLAERAASEQLTQSQLADRNNAFLQWMIANDRYDLAKNVSVRILPRDAEIRLGELASIATPQALQYYDGADQDVINTFANENAPLLHVVQSNPRRSVQLHVIRAANIASVPMTAQILRTYSPKDLSIAEASALLRISGTLRDDYLIPDVQIDFADISHGVNIKAVESGSSLHIWISRTSPILPPVLQVYDSAYELFAQFMKDFVRVHVYPKISQFVPTSTRGGVDALRGVLERNRELFRYEETERGELETILGEYLSGAATLTDVLATSRSAAQSQSQTLSSDQVGSIESVVPDVVESPVIITEDATNAEFTANPPIVRKNIKSEKKLLTTTMAYPQLNNFRIFLGLSDRLVRMNGDFFHAPHTTRILWGGHRVIFIFTDVSGRLSLYYDIQLREPIDAAKSGGEAIPTTTIITQERIFVPIPEKLGDKFDTHTGSKEFVVRFDLLSSEID